VHRGGGGEAVDERDPDRGDVLGRAELRLDAGADRVVDGVTDGVTEPSAPAAVVPSLPVAALIVRTSSTRSRTTDPITNSRRRQYTDGGWDPTGRNMTLSR
jgi:hypothetical protein